MDVEWSKEQMLNLIEQYELRGCLWNVISKNYKNQNKKKDAWQEISFHMGADVGIIENKVKSLLAQYRRERRKVTDAKKSGSGAEDIKVPKWFAYQKFTFLDGINKPRETKESKVIYTFFWTHTVSISVLLYNILTISIQ
jgi:hypothetical protein